MKRDHSKKRVFRVQKPDSLNLINSTVIFMKERNLLQHQRLSQPKRLNKELHV